MEFKLMATLGQAASVSSWQGIIVYNTISSNTPIQEGVPKLIQSADAGTNSLSISRAIWKSQQFPDENLQFHS
jgi:hypothetical protein